MPALRLKSSLNSHSAVIVALPSVVSPHARFSQSDSFIRSIWYAPLV